MPILTNCTVQFHTNDDDKDNDTHVTVTVRDSNNIIAARVDNDFGHFDNNSDNGPFGVFVINQSEKESLQTGSVTVRIDPNGHDTWKFNFFTKLMFDDGSSFSCGADGLNENQDRREQTFGIAGIIRR